MSKTLQETYNNFADIYDVNRGAFDITEILNVFYSKLEPDLKHAHLLDLGCGAGEPVARYFLDNHWKVTGVDFSERMLELATKYAPKMDAVLSDINNVKFKPNQFDAITATYSLFHIPYDLHKELFLKIYQWLKPNGKFLFTYATQEYTGEEKFTGYKKFIDTELFYSHKKPEEMISDLQAIGFEILNQKYHTICDETFFWVTVHKPNKS